MIGHISHVLSRLLRIGMCVEIFKISPKTRTEIRLLGNTRNPYELPRREIYDRLELFTELTATIRESLLHRKRSSKVLVENEVGLFFFFTIHIQTLLLGVCHFRGVKLLHTM